MPDAAGITVFDYHPPSEDSEATQAEAQDKEAVEGDGATPAAQDPLLPLRCFMYTHLYLRGTKFYTCTLHIIHNENSFHFLSVWLSWLFLVKNNNNHG